MFLFWVVFIFEFLLEWLIMLDFDNLFVVLVNLGSLDYINVMNRFYWEVGRREIVKVRVVLWL